MSSEKILGERSRIKLRGGSGEDVVRSSCKEHQKYSLAKECQEITDRR